MIIPQSVKLLLAKGSAATNGAGLAEVVIKVPGAFALPATQTRTIAGGWGYFQNQADGDWVTAEVRDDDNLLGAGAGYVIDVFHDAGLPGANQGWFFPRQQVLELAPVVDNDPTDIPAGFYLHVLAQKANIATADTFYVNIHWGKRIR